MTYRRSIYVEVPVEQVFEFFRDPGNWQPLAPAGVRYTHVAVTQEGVGTHYTWVARLALLSVDGFNVFTEFVPNKRITDRSSRSFEGTWTYVFEPAGAGTRLTYENRSGPLWRVWPVGRLMDWAARKTHDPVMDSLKARLEAAAKMTKA